MHEVRPTPDISRLIESIAELTGDEVHLLPSTTDVAESEHSWDILGTKGTLHGILRVRRDGRPLGAAQHRLYDSLSQIVADHLDLLATNRELEDRFHEAGQHNDALNQANQRLREAAFEDTVTGLYRRSYLHEQLRLEIARAQRYERPFAVLLADIDHFKNVNDQWGHAAGDTALRHLSRLMMQSSRTSDIVARFGGDEFCLLLTDTDQPGAIEVAHRILTRCDSSPVRWGDAIFHISVSIGLGAFAQDGISESISPEQILAHVDKSLYQSKRDGRGRLTTAPPFELANVG